MIRILLLSILVTCALTNAQEGESKRPKINSDEIRNLVLLLGDATCSTRERATSRLLELGEQAIPVLLDARDSIRDQPEIATRLQFLVRTIYIKAAYHRLVAPSIKWKEKPNATIRDVFRAVESQLHGSVQVLDPDVPDVLELRLPMPGENALGPLLARICHLGGLCPMFQKIPCEGGKEFLLMPSCDRQNVAGSEYVLVAACVSDRIGQRRRLDFSVLPFSPISRWIIVSSFTIEDREGRHDVVDAAVPLAKLQEKLQEIDIGKHDFRIKYSIEFPVPSDVDLFQIDNSVGSKGQIQLPSGRLTYESKAEGTVWVEEANWPSTEKCIWGFVCVTNDSGVHSFEWSNGLSGFGNDYERSRNFLPRRYPLDAMLFYGRPKGIRTISLSESMDFPLVRDNVEDQRPLLPSSPPPAPVAGVPDQQPAPPVPGQRPAPPPAPTDP
jgi:hypothetical protein